MAKSKLINILLPLLLVSCASISAMKRMEKFEQTSQAYEDAIRWSDFEAAGFFLKAQETENISAQLENLQQFKVASYTVRQFLPSKDQSQVLLIAEIQYFKVNGLILKKLSHRQLWEYDRAEERWFLTSGLPDFK